MMITRTAVDSVMAKANAMELGRKQRRRLKSALARYLEANQQTSYPHFYVSSRPGLGKTHTSLEVLREADSPHHVISGSNSMFATGICLGVIQYENPALVTINILVDDCDSMFSDIASLNTIKNVLNKDGVFRYEKSLASQRNFMTELQRQAIDHFSSEGRMGYVVPTFNLRFIFTSNICLPTDDEVYAARKSGKTKAILMAHQNAIRSRCRVLDINLTDEENWGWIADVLHNSTCLKSKGLNNEQIIDISDYLWSNWSRLTERSIRTAEKMAETILLQPDPYIYTQIWDIDFLK